MISVSEKKRSNGASVILGKSPKEIINERVTLESKRRLVYNSQLRKLFSLSFV